MGELDGKVALVTGGAQNIGRAICQELAAAGARILVNTKSSVEIAQQTVDLIKQAGGEARVAQADITDEAAVALMVADGIAAYGGIDILVNNASAIWLRGTLDTPMKRFDLMQQVNARGTFLCAQACLPLLLQAPNPHILTLAPPPSLDPKWWAPHTGYTLAKMGMSFVTLGLAAEFGPRGVAVNALWPRTLIATDALNMIPSVDLANARKPDILADAAHAILAKPAAGFTGNFLIDDEVLREAGITDLSHYAVDPSQPLLPDLFLD